MKLRRSKVITVTYNTEHDVRYRRLARARARAPAASPPASPQLDDAGTPQEHELKPGSDSGYLWRLNAYWRYEAVPGGVLIECESVSLSRAVPYRAAAVCHRAGRRLGARVARAHADGAAWLSDG